jgi:hypothetical protein
VTLHRGRETEDKNRIKPVKLDRLRTQSSARLKQDAKQQIDGPKSPQRVPFSPRGRGGRADGFGDGAGVEEVEALRGSGGRYSGETRVSAAAVRRGIGSDGEGIELGIYRWAVSDAGREVWEFQK